MPEKINYIGPVSSMYQLLKNSGPNRKTNDSKKKTCWRGDNTAASVKSLRTTHNLRVSNDKHHFYFLKTWVNYNHLRKNR
jgi:hypothetical protein